MVGPEDCAMSPRSLAAAALITAACGEVQGAPELAANADIGGIGVFIAWTHPRGEAPGGYDIEVSAGGGPFVLAGYSPPQFLSGYYRFGLSDPEQTIYAFRVRALPDDGSRTSNAATIRRGVVTPYLECRDIVSGGECYPIFDKRFDLSWSPAPSSPDLFQLERQTLAFDYSPISEWIVLVAPSRTTSYSDSDLSGWVHHQRYAYKLSAFGPDGERGDRAWAIATWQAPL